MQIQVGIKVLILVFMEVILLRSSGGDTEVTVDRFNPCFYGSYSFTIKITSPSATVQLVLILVFMEVILLQLDGMINSTGACGFNPCFYGSYSFTRRNSTH